MTIIKRVGIYRHHKNGYTTPDYVFEQSKMPFMDRQTTIAANPEIRLVHWGIIHDYIIVPIF